MSGRSRFATVIGALGLLLAGCASIGTVETSGTTSTLAPTATEPPATEFVPEVDGDGDGVPGERVEPTGAPFSECGPGGDGPVPNEREAELQVVRDALEADGLFDQPHVVSAGGPSNVWGKITIGLRARHQPTIEWLAARADPADLCLELPPPGYYDQPPTLADWELRPEGDDPRNVTLLVTDGTCGLIDPTRILEPQVEFSDDQILIAVPLRVPNWGPTVLPCLSPNEIPLTLAEDPAGRPILAAPDLLTPLEGLGPPAP